MGKGSPGLKPAVSPLLLRASLLGVLALRGLDDEVLNMLSRGEPPRGKGSPGLKPPRNPVSEGSSLSGFDCEMLNISSCETPPVWLPVTFPVLVLVLLPEVSALRGLDDEVLNMLSWGEPPMGKGSPGLKPARNPVSEGSSLSGLDCEMLNMSLSGPSPPALVPVVPPTVFSEG